MSYPLRSLHKCHGHSAPQIWPFSAYHLPHSGDVRPVRSAGCYQLPRGRAAPAAPAASCYSSAPHAPRPHVATTLLLPRYHPAHSHGRGGHPTFKAKKSDAPAPWGGCFRFTEEGSTTQCVHKSHGEQGEVFSTHGPFGQRNAHNHLFDVPLLNCPRVRLLEKVAEWSSPNEATDEPERVRRVITSDGLHQEIVRTTCLYMGPKTWIEGPVKELVACASPPSTRVYSGRVGDEYPLLRGLGGQILSTSASNAEPERVGSDAGYVITPERNCICPPRRRRTSSSTGAGATRRRAAGTRRALPSAHVAVARRRVAAGSVRRAATGWAEAEQSVVAHLPPPGPRARDRSSPSTRC